MYDQINTLLAKYWDGETTLEEERMLKDYFNSGAVDPRLQHEAAWFQGLRAEQQVRMPAKEVKLHAPWYRGGYRWAAAAVLALFVAIAVVWRVQDYRAEQEAIALQQKLEQDTYEDPQKAAEEIKAALALVSRKLNKGKKTANEGLKKVQVVEKYMPKPTKKQKEINQ